MTRETKDGTRENSGRATGSRRPPVAGGVCNGPGGAAEVGHGVCADTRKETPGTYRTGSMAGDGGGMTRKAKGDGT
jgi:hypothetical protein